MDEYKKIATDFCHRLMAEDYESAQGFMKDDSDIDLKENYQTMLDYCDAPAHYSEVMEVMQDWPAKQANDLVWVYVAICGDDFSEALTLVFCLNHQSIKIREIEWGRP